MKIMNSKNVTTLSEKELRNVMGGLIPPPQNENEKKSPVQQGLVIYVPIFVFNILIISIL